MPSETIYTIGHSTHPLDHFIAMLRSFDIKLLADIRSFPGSRRFPQFNKESLQVSLMDSNIKYIHIKGLGGRRNALPDSHNTAWRLPAFRGYADYMETENFIKAAEDLAQYALKETTAYMCSEAVWWSCHRSLVSDYFKFNGWKVIHIMGIARSEEHPYTKAANVDSGKLSYVAPNTLFKDGV